MACRNFILLLRDIRRQARRLTTAIRSFSCGTSSASVFTGLVDSGPFSFIRHPTYTAAILAFLCLGLCFGNWVSILFLSLPIIGALLWRIHIEERAVIRRTRRTVPRLHATHQASDPVHFLASRARRAFSTSEGRSTMRPFSAFGSAAR